MNDPDLTQKTDAELMHIIDVHMGGPLALLARIELARRMGERQQERDAHRQDFALGLKTSGARANEILSQMAKDQRAANDELLREIRKPQWKTPIFWISVIAAASGCLSAYPVLFPGSQSAAIAPQSGQATAPGSPVSASSPQTSRIQSPQR